MSAYEQIVKDTDRARLGQKPDVLTDVYGARPPAAARHDGGVSDQAGAQQAQDARRNARPGDYHSARGSR
jgi:hypothetical protein